MEEVSLNGGVLPAQLRAMAALALPIVAGWLASHVAGTNAAGWTTAITYTASGAYFIYDTFMVKKKIKVALNTTLPQVGVVPANQNIGVVK